MKIQRINDQRKLNRDRGVIQFSISDKSESKLNSMWKELNKKWEPEWSYTVEDTGENGEYETSYCIYAGFEDDFKDDYKIAKDNI